MTLYRKHRPQTIEELDLKNVRDSLKQISSSLNNIPHGFLFAGPRGTGKTSAARLLSKLLNCENLVENKTDDKTYFEPCNKCDQCTSIQSGQNIDVIEMDAASNRGIDDIRSLRESVGLAPASARKKVYIIDEAHMLTTEAANAFLKTLEEPPSHVSFILATTDPEKLPLTVRSRLTLLPFQKASESELKRQLDRLVKSEKLELEDGVIDLIIEKSDGSFRDATKLIEDLSLLGKKITLENANLKISTNTSEDIENLSLLITQKKLEKILLFLDNFSNSGGSVKDLTDKLTKEFRRVLHVLNGLTEGEDYDLRNSEVIKLLELLMESRSKNSSSAISTLPLEIVLVKWCGINSEASEKALKKKPKKVENIQVGERKELDDSSWLQILSKLRDKNASIEALLRASKPMGIVGNTLSVGVYYRFHKEKLENIALRKTLEDVCSDVLGISPIRVVCSLAERETPLPEKQFDPPLAKVEDASVVQAAKDVFS